VRKASSAVTGSNQSTESAEVPSTIKIVFARGDVARAAAQLKHLFVDQQVEVQLVGWKHTKFSPGCEGNASVDIPGGARPFRAATPELLKHYHMELLVDTNVQLCRNCIDRLRFMDPEEQAQDTENHRAELIARHGAELLPANVLIAMASLITLLYWLQGAAKKLVWCAPHAKPHAGANRILISCP